jgi:hypothetical protein
MFDADRACFYCNRLSSIFETIEKLIIHDVPKFIVISSQGREFRSRPHFQNTIRGSGSSLPFLFSVYIIPCR